jgi:hypothetical protein
LKRDDDAYEVAVYVLGNKIEGKLFVEHNVIDEWGSCVRSSQNFIGIPHPHLGKLAPLEFAIDEHLLPSIFQNPNPKTMKLRNKKEKNQTRERTRKNEWWENGID